MIFLRGLPLWREALRGLAAILCNVIYSIISLMFQVFVTVAQANIFDEKTLAPIYQRVTLILTIVMTFYITFEFIKYIIQPDTMGDKEKGVGNIAVKIVIVIALIAMVPKIFSLAYNLQGRIINQNVIGKVILGSTDQDYNKLGYEFSTDMLGEFYKIGECRNSSSKCQSTGTKYDENIDKIKTTGVVNILPGINDSENEDQGGIFENETPAIDFNGFMAIIVGGLIVYILVLYSIDLGVRYAQLLYLQVIAPIAIMGYLLPKKDGIFQKWTKQCFTTYLDLFIRLSVIYFVLLLIDMIGNNKTSIFAGIPGTNGAIETFAYIAIVLGLLLFAQRAPKLLQELFPSSGAAGIGMGLKAGDRVAPLAARGIGAALASTRVVGAVGRRMASAAIRNRKNGQHSRLTKAGQEEERQRRRNREKARNLAGMAEATDELNEAENNLMSANRRLNEAKKRGASKEEIAKLEGDRDAALERYKKANSEFTDNDIYKQDLNNFKQAGLNLRNANAELEAARRSGDANRIANAQMAVEKAKSDFNKANQNMDQYRRETAESARNRLEENKQRAEATPEYGAMTRTQEYSDYARTQEQLNGAKERLKEAEKTGNQEIISRAQAELEKASEENKSAREKLNSTKEYSDYRNAYTKSSSEAELNDAYNSVVKAQNELKDAQKSKDVNRIIEANKALTAAESNYSAAKEKHFEIDNNRTETASNFRSQAESTAEQVVKDDNEAYISLAGAAASGVVGTVKNIMTSGAKATKLEDIGKKVKEGVQKDIKEVQEINKYIDEGGATGIKGTINRTVQQIEKNIGIETQYQRTILESKAIEPKIKNLEAKSSLTKDIKSTADSAEDRLKDKIDELKQSAEGAVIETGLMVRDQTTGQMVKQTADISKGETLGDVHRKYLGRATSAQAESESAAKSLQEFEAEHAAELASIEGKDQATLSDNELKMLGTRNQLRDTANKKATDAANAKYAADQIQKNAARYQYTSILEDMANGMNLDQVKAKGIYDAVAVEKVQDALDSLKVARQNPEIVADMKERLKNNPQFFEAFMSGRITNFEMLDKIKTAAINAANAYDRSLKDLKEQKRSIETSNKTAAEKAANDFNGGGSGK